MGRLSDRIKKITLKTRIKVDIEAFLLSKENIPFFVPINMSKEELIEYNQKKENVLKDSHILLNDIMKSISSCNSNKYE